MTPIASDGSVRRDVMVSKSSELMSLGMSGGVDCGSIGDWALLSDE